MDERRVARRYDVAVPVLVGLPGLRQRQRPRGLTRDISTSGLYFTLDHSPRPGARVELTLTLPGSLTGGSDLLVEVVGRVVRIDARVDSRLDNPGDARADSRVVTRADGGSNSRIGSDAGSAARALAASAVGVAAHIVKYDIISTRPAHQGSDYAQ